MSDASEPEPLVLPCRACGGELERVAAVADAPGMLKGVLVETYACTASGCGRKTVLVWEPVGGATPDQKTWVEKEVMRAGSFFPGDYARNRGLGRPW